MRNFKHIILELKVYLLDKSNKEKIKDKDVAKALNMSASRFATLKKRDTTPYEDILKFCKEENLCCDRFFYTH